MDTAIRLHDSGTTVTAAQLVLVSLGLLDGGHLLGRWDVESQAAVQRWAASRGVARCDSATA